jgi:uncharacterized flavoprotein (TIGR03862 family)
MTLTAAGIGGGPAGLMAAEVLAGDGVAVTLYDQMPSVGRKLLLAGRGGLNLTHADPMPAFLSRYGAARVWLEPMIAAFPPAALIGWCNGLGQPTFVGSSARVFPTSMKASPLLRAWLRRLADLSVRIRARHRWVGRHTDGTLAFETPDGVVLDRPCVTILALGGASWPRLGSDAGWAPLLPGLLAPFRPANCGFVVDWSRHFRTRFAGRPLKRLAIRFGPDTVRGEAVITETGLEGGAIYTLSGRLRDAIQARGAATIQLTSRPQPGGAGGSPPRPASESVACKHASEASGPCAGSHRAVARSTPHGR